MNWNVKDDSFYKNELEADIGNEKDDNESEKSDVLDLEKRSPDPKLRKGRSGGFQEDFQEDVQEDVQEDAQEDVQEEGPGKEGAGEEGAEEEGAEEEGVQQYVPRYATMEEYAVGVKKAKRSQTIDIHTVSSC